MQKERLLFFLSVILITVAIGIIFYYLTITKISECTSNPVKYVFDNYRAGRIIDYEYQLGYEEVEKGLFYNYAVINYYINKDDTIPVRRVKVDRLSFLENPN